VRLEDRLSLARQAYQRAVLVARSATTAASWRRLRAAARNLAQARRDRETGRARSARSNNPVRSARSAGERTGGTLLRLPVGQAERPTPAERPVRRAIPAVAGQEPDLWLSLVAEHQRTRRLLAETRALVRKLEALRTEWAALRASIAALCRPDTDRS
jgi:hypothetical protein